MKTFCLVFTLGVLWSCQKQKNPTFSDQSFIHLKMQNAMGRGNEIFRDLPIEEKTFITNVVEGDRIHITAYGWKEEPKYSVYSQSFQSRWKTYECLPGYGNGCYWTEKNGTCEIYYRKEEKRELLPIFSEENSEDYPLHLVLGEKDYPLTNVKFEGSFQFIEVTITAEMLKSGNDLYLNVKEGPSEKIKLGFLNYGRCPRKKLKDFRVDAPKKSEIITGQVENYMRASAKLEPRDDGPYYRKRGLY